MEHFVKVTKAGFFGVAMLAIAGCDVAKEALQGTTAGYSSDFCSLMRSSCIPADSCVQQKIYPNCF